jgi:xanthine dehydrogenase small subunit
MIYFILNDQSIRTDLPAGTTVLDFVRYHRRLSGTKIGCREGDCGACTVLVGELQHPNGVRYRAMTSCLTPLSNVQHKHVVTIEGINPTQAGSLTPVQEAMVSESATQCGFCTPGFVMSLTNFFLSIREQEGPEQAIAAIDGNICRCTGYKSIERAAMQLTALSGSRTAQTPLEFAVEKGIVPEYFLQIPKRLTAMQPAATASAANVPGHGPQLGEHPVILGGGTDLYVQHPEVMVHTQADARFDNVSLREIRDLGDYVEIGASATVTDLLESPVMNACFPRLKEHLKLVSSTPIRNMATVAGNLVNASPIGDLTVWLLAMNASITLRNGNTREIPLRDFYSGYKTMAKTAGEILEHIRFQKPGNSDFFNFEKVSKRTHLDIASVNSALFLRVENELITGAHLAVGGVAPIPLYLIKTSAFFIGKALPKGDPLDSDLLREADVLMQSEISPISDVRGSAAYKRLLARQLLWAHFLNFTTEARRHGDERGL